ncbi:hypothetical protein ACH5RR_012727 [Cinchona calisaya]|uniref:CCHC-type domain-containing protein n=1 Tax=Cinchona calisaya TaxID=153742 RepID=A0ABD3AAX9_9GENT
MAANNTSTLSLRSILEKDKLNGTNFLDWFRGLRIVLKQERKLYVLDNPIPEQPAANAPRAERDAYSKHSNDSVDVGCFMLATMSPDLQKDLEHLEAFEMVNHLKEMFQQQARQERFDTTKALHSCKMAEGAPVSPHVLKMKGHIDHLERLGFPISQELATDLILNSLPESYSQFVMNFNMNNMEKSVSELHLMLKTAEHNIKKMPGQVLMVHKGKGMKTKGRSNKAYKKKPYTQNKPKNHNKPKPPKEGVCHFCNEPGHWKRNCKLYLEDLKKKKSSETTTSGSEKK